MQVGRHLQDAARQALQPLPGIEAVGVDVDGVVIVDLTTARRSRALLRPRREDVVVIGVVVAGPEAVARDLGLLSWRNLRAHGMMSGVGVKYEYFAAPSDAAAADLVQAGPGGPLPASPALREALRARDREALRLAMRPKVRLSDSDVLVLATTGIDPVVQMGTLEALLTGERYDVIARRPRAGHVVAERGEGQALVVTLTDELQAALAAAPGDQIRAAAAPWSHDEEWDGLADPDTLAQFLLELADLARQAGQRGERLYCWVCL